MTPGHRLRRARMLNGHKSRTALSDVASEKGYFITADRIGRLERDDSDPTIPEIQALCNVLKMSADWWLRDDHAPPEAISKHVNRMTYKQRRLLMDFIDLMRDAS